MSNKNTCGECKHYIPEMYHCKKHDVMAEAPNTCEDCTAKNISNGDKIRQMANAELAKLIVPKVMFCNGCPVKCKEKNIPQNNQSDPFGVENIEDVCTKRVEAWLNAPAESEGEDE